jgi:hypothetical protein
MRFPGTTIFVLWRIDPLISSDSVDSGRCCITHATSVLYMIRSATIAMQRRGKNTCTTIERLCFLRDPCRGVILKIVGAVPGGYKYGDLTL